MGSLWNRTATGQSVVVLAQCSLGGNPYVMGWRKALQRMRVDCSAIHDAVVI